MFEARIHLGGQGRRTRRKSERHAADYRASRNRQSVTQTDRGGGVDRQHRRVSPDWAKPKGIRRSSRGEQWRRRTACEVDIPAHKTENAQPIGPWRVVLKLERHSRCKVWDYPAITPGDPISILLRELAVDRSCRQLCGEVRAGDE